MNKEKGAIGYILLWLMGVPATLLFLIFLLRGCQLVGASTSRTDPGLANVVTTLAPDGSVVRPRPLLSVTR